MARRGAGGPDAGATKRLSAPRSARVPTEARRQIDSEEKGPEETTATVGTAKVRCGVHRQTVSALEGRSHREDGPNLQGGRHDI